MLSSGHMAGRHVREGGGGSNFLCLPEEPQWNNQSSAGEATGWLYGVEYGFDGDRASFFSTLNTGGHRLQRTPVPCAVCYVSQRSASVMMPASTSCPVGWTREYGGYIMSEHSFSENTPRHPRHATSFTCIDQAPEIATGGVSRHNVAIHVVRLGCGTLPCSKYPDDWVLVCIVCSR